MEKKESFYLLSFYSASSISELLQPFCPNLSETGTIWMQYTLNLIFLGVAFKSTDVFFVFFKQIPI